MKCCAHSIAFASRVSIHQDHNVCGDMITVLLTQCETNSKFAKKKKLFTGVCGVTASKQLIHTEPASTERANVSAQSIFFVKIPAANPYDVLLDRSITSSSVLNFNID